MIAKLIKKKKKKPKYIKHTYIDQQKWEEVITRKIVL